jgi:hypothetical protein
MRQVIHPYFNSQKEGRKGNAEDWKGEDRRLACVLMTAFACDKQTNHKNASQQEPTPIPVSQDI